VIALLRGPLVTRLTDAGVRTQVHEAGRFRQPRGYLRTCWRLDNELRAARYHAVVSNETKGHLYAALLARCRRIPAFWFQAGYPVPATAFDRLASALPAAGVIAESRDAAAAQRQLNRRRTVHVLHLGTDLSRFTVKKDPALRAQYAIPADAVLVSLVGRLQPWKGQLEFLRAAALIAADRPNVWFAVVGGRSVEREADYPRAVGRLAAGLDFRDRIVFAGHSNEVHRWMAASDVVVNASQPEPFGLVVIEAMASGCAVAAVDRGGPRDIIENEQSGLLVPSRQPLDLARSIRVLVDEPALRLRFGRNARQRVETQFSRERMTERFAAIIRSPYAAASTAAPSGAAGRR
jgi:glycosyltransferase involved in cell wall biosynthesis